MEEQSQEAKSLSANVWQLSVQVRALESQVNALEKRADDNALRFVETLGLVSQRMHVLGSVLEDIVRGEVRTGGLGSIDFDHYLMQYAKAVQKIETEQKTKAQKEDEAGQEDRPFEFGGDYG